MRKFIQQKLKEQKGLTLIELLAVIVILAIIAAIAIPAIGNIISNSRHNAVKADFQNVLSAGNLYFTEKGSADGETFTQATANVGDFIDDDGSVSTFTVTKASGGNKIYGTAVVDTTTYEIPAATPLTNEQLSGMDAAQIEALIDTTP